MSPKPAVCVDIEPDLLAVASAEAEPPAARRVEDHVRRCAPCRDELARYRAIERVVGDLRREVVPAARLERARQDLRTKLADFRSRIVTYRIFPSPLGRILIARSEHGVSLVEYLGRGDLRASRLGAAVGLEACEDAGEIEALARELLEYLAGKRKRLAWALDLRLARSEFQRAVLEATAALPYGAVTSYARIAAEIGKRAATRAVAQALRWNPLPIVVPCHRVVGASGSLTGYAGNKVTLKQRLLAVEGVPTLRARHDLQVARDRMYAQNRDESAYCLPTCGSLQSRTLADLTLFGSRERAEAAGLSPCTTCRPDLHPISRSPLCGVIGARRRL